MTPEFVLDMLVFDNYLMQVASETDSFEVCSARCEAHYQMHLGVCVRVDERAVYVVRTISQLSD